MDLLTAEELRVRGQTPAGRRPDGYVLVELYDAAAVAPSTASAARQRAVDARRAEAWARQVLSDADTVLLSLVCAAGHGRIIEIAVIRADGEVLLDTLVNPRSEPIGAASIHGLTDAMLAAPGVPTFAELDEQLRELLAGRHIVSWNVEHDQTHLAAEANPAEPAHHAGTACWSAHWQDAAKRHTMWVAGQAILSDGTATASEVDDAASVERDHDDHDDHEEREDGGDTGSLADCYTLLEALRTMAAGRGESAGSAKSGVEVRDDRYMAVWCEDEDSELVRLYERDEPLEQIADCLDRTVCGVRWRLYKLDLLPFPADLVRKRDSMPAAPANTLADLREVHRNSHKRWSTVEDIQLAARAGDGATVEQLAEEFGRKAGAIRTRLAEIACRPGGLPPF